MCHRSESKIYLRYEVYMTARTISDMYKGAFSK